MSGRVEWGIEGIQRVNGDEVGKCGGIGLYIGFGAANVVIVLDGCPDTLVNPRSTPACVPTHTYLLFHLLA